MIKRDKRTFNFLFTSLLTSLFLVLGLMVKECSTIAFAAPTPPSYSNPRIGQLEATVGVLKQEVRLLKAQAAPDKLRNLELQLLALRDRLKNLETRFQKNKEADEQVLIDLIKRTNNLHKMLTTHRHK